MSRWMPWGKGQPYPAEALRQSQADRSASLDKLRAELRLAAESDLYSYQFRPKPEPLPRPVPKVTECVVGFRAWEVDAFGRLWPMGRHAATGPWVPGVNTAKCAAHTGDRYSLYLTTAMYGSPKAPAGHKAPHKSCTCGFYARFEQSFDEGVQSTDDKPLPRLMGSIAAWGDVQVHTDGFRAEHAQITSLAVPTVGYEKRPLTAEEMAAQRRRLTSSTSTWWHEQTRDFKWEKVNVAPPAELCEIAERVATKYGVPLVGADDLMREGMLHGDLLPKGMVPPPPQRDSYPWDQWSV